MLIHHRYLLIGSSISMGGIATWAMHFVGNLAILLGDGNSTSQVVYSPIHTALSFFVPIIVFLTAFIIVGSNEKVNWMRVGFGGAMAGLAICGMHYLSQAGISNYTVGYKIANVVGSAIIAVVATITALFVFFMLRAAWISSWWKRAFNAVILAGAVSGMHWVAEVGTQYRPRRADSSVDRNISRSTTVIVVILLVCITLSPWESPANSYSLSRLVLFCLSFPSSRKEGGPNPQIEPSRSF